jgi:hypothetical protein
MGVSLIKEEWRRGQPTMTDTLQLHENVHCDLCEQSYAFGYSTGEVNRLNEWRSNSKNLINQSHPDHALASLPLRL